MAKDEQSNLMLPLTGLISAFKIVKSLVTTGKLPERLPWSSGDDRGGIVRADRAEIDAKLDENPLLKIPGDEETKTS